MFVKIKRLSVGFVNVIAVSKPYLIKIIYYLGKQSLVVAQEK